MSDGDRSPQDRHRAVMEILGSALERPAGERRAYLDEACAARRELRREVEELLALDGEAPELVVAVGPDLTGSGAIPTQPPPEDDPDRPERIGPYRVLGVLGRGGMGSVYLAERDEPIHRRAAVKLISAPVRDDVARRRFAREQQAMARLSHPHIAKIFDAGTSDEGFPYFAMEVVDGLSLTTDADRHRLPVRKRVETMVAVCRAVEHAHRRGVLHRDLKPGNVLVERVDGSVVPRIIDFGIAKALDDPLADSTLTAPQAPIGTPAYMSPEALATAVGEGDVDTRSDVYSLGVMLFELLVGVRPFAERESRLGPWIRDALGTEPPRPSTRFGGLTGEARRRAAETRSSTVANLARQLEGDLGWIAWRALARDREARYPSAAALADDLEAWLEGLPVSAHPPSFAYRARKLVARHRVAASAAAVAVVAFVLGFAGTVGGFVRASREAERAAAEAARATEEAEAANRVASFLEELFDAADPGRDAGEISARELLERGRVRLEHDLADDPRMMGRLLVTVARVHGRLGRYDDAAELARRGLAANEAGGTGVAARAEALEVLGRQLGRGGHPDEGLEQLRRSLELRRAVGDELAVADSLHEIGALFAELQDAEQAEAALEEALEIRRRYPERDPEKEGLLLNTLGNVRTRQERWEEAEALFTEGLALVEAGGEIDSMDRMTLLANLAVVQKFRGRLEEAGETMRRALEIARRIFDPPHPHLANTLGNLGEFSLNQGRLDEAEALLDEGHEMLLAVHDDRAHVDVGRSWLRMTALRIAQQRWEEAEATGLRAREILREVLGPQHPVLAEVTNGLGWGKLQAERYAEAEEYFREALAALERDPSAVPGPGVANVLNNLGRALLGRGEAAEAEAHVRRALEIREGTLGPDHPHTVLAVAWLARALVDLGRNAEALPLYERAAAATGDAATAIDSDAVRSELERLRQRTGR